MFDEYIKRNPTFSALEASLSPEFQWWEARRLQYNIGLVVAGILAFIAYILVLSVFGDIILPKNLSEDDTFSGLTLVLQGIGYLFMMFVANICYFLGALSERWLHPRDVAAYRKIAYRLT